MKKNRFYLLILVALVVLMTAACSIIESHSTEKVFGKEFEAETLSQLELGRTTKNEAIALLGPPSEAKLQSEGRERLTYTMKRVTNRHGHLLFVIDTSSKVERRESLYLDFKDDVLIEYRRDRN